MATLAPSENNASILQELGFKLAEQQQSKPTTTTAASESTQDETQYDEVDFKKTAAIMVLKAKPQSMYTTTKDDGCASSSSIESLTTNYVDILDPRDEDTFTLETFESLILRARAVNKSFILARVTTQDSPSLRGTEGGNSNSNGGKTYYSHYPAHLLNKILFRTQPEAGLLHRMKCRNPRNNMEIIGPVEYFVIRPEKVDQAMRSYERARGQAMIKSSSCMHLLTEVDTGSTSTLASDTARSECHLLDNQSVQKNQHPHNHNSNHQDNPFLKPPAPISERLHQAIVSHGIDVPENDPIIIYEASFFGTDEDFLTRAEVRDYFKRNSVGPEDYLLFTLFRSNDPMTIWQVGGGIVDGTPLVSNAVASPMANALSSAFSANQIRASWKNLWGTLMPFGESCLTERTGFINPVAWIVVSIAMLALFMLALKIVIPEPFWMAAIGAYVIGFVLFSCLFVRTSSRPFLPSSSQRPRRTSAV